jgi:hypothetical protein
VLSVGAVAGSLLSLVTLGSESRPGPLPFYPVGLEALIVFQLVLSTVGVALLVSLVVVYARIYSATGANFALGLLVVLGALLLNSLLRFPPLFFVALSLGPIGPVSVGIGLFPPIAEVFMVLAYAVFLYLSLE